MQDVAFRKNKIGLDDYDYSKDIANRALMISLTPEEMDVLEEILYSSLKIPLSLLEKNVGMSPGELLLVLQKLLPTGLFKIEAEHLIVDKETRKHFEFQILRFEEGFKPSMDYVQQMLKKVPIHLLPIWYLVPRASNNIFESIVEKYFQTPQAFQRYLSELHVTNPIQAAIVDEVYKASSYEVEMEMLLEKFGISQIELEEHLLFLEFSFACFGSYRREKGVFRGVVTPLFEWQEYLWLIEQSLPASCPDQKRVIKDEKEEFSKLRELGDFMHRLDLQAKKALLGKEERALIKMLSSLELVQWEEEGCSLKAEGRDWLAKPYREKALYLYRHPLEFLQTMKEFDLTAKETLLFSERSIHEAVKSICRIAGLGWVRVKDFLNTLIVGIDSAHIPTLVRQGKSWKYQLPEYNQEEKAFFEAIVCDWLSLLGITTTGISDKGEKCFCLTTFGLEFFGNDE